MANISTSLADWSSTAASNQPDSSDTNTIQADLQAIQAAVKGAFPNVTGAVNATHTELNYVDGVTSAIQTQLDAKVGAGANSSITSLSGLTTPLSVAQGGTGATTNAGTAYALKGANNDITSLAGLTTPLSVAQGGIGAATLTANYALLGNGTSAPQMIAPGTSGNVLTSDGTTWASSAPPSAGFTLGTPQATTSGTTIDFGSIPAGVKQVILSLSNVSFSANSLNLSFRLGTGGTPQTTGYESGAASIAVTANTTVGNVASTGFVLPTTGTAGGGVGVSGSVTFTLLDSSSNLWACSGNVTFGGNPGAIASIAGKVALSGALDIVRLYGGTFDAGSANIAYI